MELNGKVGTIKVKAIDKLTCGSDTKDIPQIKTTETPYAKKTVRKRAATTTKKVKLQDENNAKTDALKLNTNGGRKAESASKQASRSNKKELLSGQKTIDSYYKSAAKTYKIEAEVKTTKMDSTRKNVSTIKRNNTLKSVTKKAKVRKRLYTDATDTETSTTASTFEEKAIKRRRQPNRSTKKALPKLLEPAFTVDLCSDSESENKAELSTKLQECKQETNIQIPANPTPMVRIPLNNAQTPLLKPMPASPSGKHVPIKNPINETASTCSKGRTRKPKQCPPYKVVEGTTFAVDAFQFGDIPNVTHYFLTHYHADHYIGLTGKFCNKLYASRITARLVRAFIPLDAQYLHELELNKSVEIEGVEVTAIDANHCPGAIMIVFKLPTGKCILHTGDFRACADMESEPIFWNNDISLIYLDTTYLCNKYDFCHQYESIDKAKSIIDQFREKHKGKRILYVCGSYLIGKEKMWKALALEYELNVWTEPNRFKSLSALEDEEINLLLCKDREKANLHVISMMKLHYQSLVEYFQPLQSEYDVLLAIRPSGWEKNSRPQYRGRINLVGIEYSEHSSFTELERFVKYLKPERVISTVPVSRDLFITAKVPQIWYNYKGHGRMTKCFQQSITNFMKSVPSKKSLGNATNMFVSPGITQTEAENSRHINEVNQNSTQVIVSRASKKLNFSDKEQDDVVTICESVSTVYESKTVINESDETVEWQYSSPTVLQFNGCKESQDSIETEVWQPQSDIKSKKEIKSDEQELKSTAKTDKSVTLLPKNEEIQCLSDASDDWLT